MTRPALILARGLLLLLLPVARASAAAAPGQQEEKPTAAATAAATADETPDEPPLDDTWYERVVVTATRSEVPAAKIPLHITVIDREQIESAPELGLREIFQRVPNVNLASEEGTLTAGPNQGGIAFRGMGGTAQSRSLVLLDGLPVNDPFGSYLLWARIPKDLIERVEVVPGAGGSWGNLALSGVVNLITVAASDRSVSVNAQLGNFATREGTALYSDVGDRWSGWISGTALDSDGYVNIEDRSRAPNDVPSRNQYETWSGKLSHSWSPSAALHLNATSYDEDRSRGTPLSMDASTEQALNGTVDLTGGASSWQLRFFGRDVGLEETESLEDANRATETRDATLDAPSDSFGASAVWLGDGGPRHALTAGTDLMLIAVESTTDFQPIAGTFTRRVFTEGEQRFAGFFAQDLFEPSPRWSLLYGARFDLLSTLDGRRLETDLVTGQQTETILIDRTTETTVDPSFGAVYAASSTTRLRGSVYTGFRAATASELFVNNIGRNRIASNPELAPERLVGAEAGVDFTPSRRSTTRFTAYWSEGRDLIERIFVGRGARPDGSVVGPCGFLQAGAQCTHRENLGKVRAKGLEIEQQVRLEPHWRIDFFGTLLESRVTENPAAPAFVGNGLERTPDEAGTLSLTYENPRLFQAVARASYVGDRWDDAANESVLEDHTLVDLSFSRPVGTHWVPFAGITNLLDDEYVIDYRGEGAYHGAPRMYHVGIRFRS